MVKKLADSLPLSVMEEYLEQIKNKLAGVVRGRYVEEVNH